MRSCEADEREQADQCTRVGGLAGSHAALRGVEWWWVGVMGWGDEMATQRGKVDGRVASARAMHK